MTKITPQPIHYTPYDTNVTHNVGVVPRHPLISLEPTRVRNQEDFHRSEIRVFDTWGHLNEQTRRHIVLLIVNREYSRSFDDVIDASKSLAYHERVMPLVHIDKVGSNILMF